MSKFSMRYDFADDISLNGLERTLQCDIFVGDKTINKAGDPVEYKDLIPFLPNGIRALAPGIIILFRDSNVDIAEAKTRDGYLFEMKSIYNRCKEDGEPFNIDKITHFMTNNMQVEGIKKLAERFLQNVDNENVSYDDIHLYEFSYYRRSLVDEMLEYDLNPRDYGLGYILDEFYD